MTTETPEVSAALAKLAELNAEQARLTIAIADAELEVVKLRKATYPHKEGDVIVTDGQKAKVKSVIAGTEGVFMLVNYQLPSGRWSKHASYHW